MKHGVSVHRRVPIDRFVVFTLVVTMLAGLAWVAIDWV